MSEPDHERMEGLIEVIKIAEQAIEDGYRPRLAKVTLDAAQEELKSLSASRQILQRDEGRCLEG